MKILNLDDIHENEYLWWSQGSRFIQVKSIDPHQGLVEGQLLNSSTPKRVHGWKSCWWTRDKINALRPTDVRPDWVQYDLPVDRSGYGYGLEPWLEIIPFEELVPLRVGAHMDNEGELRLPKRFRSFARGF